MAQEEDAAEAVSAKDAPTEAPLPAEAAKAQEDDAAIAQEDALYEGAAIAQQEDEAAQEEAATRQFGSQQCSRVVDSARQWPQSAAREVGASIA